MQMLLSTNAIRSRLMDSKLSGGFAAAYAMLFVTLVFWGMILNASPTLVDGVVLDSSGRKVPHAFVEAVPLLAKSTNGTIGNTPSPWIPADESGAFKLELSPGQYRIRAKAEADGYPDPSFWVGRDPTSGFPEIHVGEKELVNIKVVLGQRGGILMGTVEDSQNHKPINGAKVRIQDARNELAYVEVFTGSAGRFQYTILSKPLLVFISAAGYKPFRLNNGDEVTVSPAEHREVTVPLQTE